MGNSVSQYSQMPEFAGLDNDLRFLAMCWLVVGGAMALAAIQPVKYRHYISLGLFAVILGGFARLYGFVEYGPLPHEFIPIAIEFGIGIPLYLIFLSWHRSLGSVTRQPDPKDVEADHAAEAASK